MTEERIVELVKRLLERTQAGKQSWETTPSGEAFLTSFPKYSVKIGKFWDQQGEAAEIGITIYDENGTPIETMLDSKLHEKLPQSNAYDLMRDLYAHARRQALNVDGVIDDLLSSMNE